MKGRGVADQQSVPPPINPPVVDSMICGDDNTIDP
jgi:hypothetical protein